MSQAILRFVQFTITIPEISSSCLSTSNGPSVFDFRVMPSSETPNGSNLETEGYDATWVNGVFSEITAFLANKPAKLPAIHRHSAYDILLYPIGIPFAFWVCQKLSDTVYSVFTESSFVRNAAFVYLFVGSLVVFRVLFHYLRWVAPMAEYRFPASSVNTHRTLLAALMIGTLGTFVYDMLRYLFSS